MNWIEWILIFSTGSYTILIISFYIGWEMAPVNVPAPSCNTFFSVIVAARNEQENICKCLESLAAQNYPADSFEVIVVDDHSSDKTYELAGNYIKRNGLSNFRIISLKDKAVKPGKKNAVTTAINNSSGGIVVMTDADCISGLNWLSVINAWVEHFQPTMLIGPVALSPCRNMFEKMQSLEFCSLTGTTGGAAGLGHPIMCNGANLVFNKKAFCEVNGFEGNMQYASGDDVFLLHKFLKRENSRILFLKNKEAIVHTPPVAGLNQFFRQRIRWASKAKGYKDLFTLFVAIVVAVVNVMLLAVLVSLLLKQHLFFAMSGLALLLKGLVDYLLLWKVTGFYLKKGLMLYFPLVFFIYPFYIIASVLGSFAGPGAKKWK